MISSDFPLFIYVCIEPFISCVSFPTRFLVANMQQSGGLATYHAYLCAIIMAVDHMNFGFELLPVRIRVISLGWNLSP